MSQTPKGWKLVPVEATEAMEAAATKRIRPYHDMLDSEWRSRLPGDLFRLAWPALLDAAPEPPADHLVASDPDVEAAAKWHDRRADEAMGSLHCGSENWEYREAGKTADMHRLAAKAIRSLAKLEDQP